MKAEDEEEEEEEEEDTDEEEKGKGEKGDPLNEQTTVSSVHTHHVFSSHWPWYINHAHADSQEPQRHRFQDL